LEAVGLLRLQHFDDVGLDNVGALFSDNLFFLQLIPGALHGLPLKGFLWNYVSADGIRFKSKVRRDFFVWFENGLFDLFVEQFDARVAKLHHCSLELLFLHVGDVLDSSAGDRILLVEEAEDSRLEHVRNDLVLLWRVHQLQLHRAIVKEPRQLPVAVRGLVPHLEPLCALFHFHR
jgi:hypothetical protein